MPYDNNIENLKVGDYIVLHGQAKFMVKKITKNTVTVEGGPGNKTYTWKKSEILSFSIMKDQIDPPKFGYSVGEVKERK